MIEEEIINIVICYNNASEVMEYYNEILSLDEGYKVGYVVVINSSTGEDVDSLLSFGKENNHVYIFNPGKNLGYMNGLLHGYRRYREQTGLLPKYVIMSNTDIKYVNKTFFTDLFAKNYPRDLACVGPSILVNEYKSYDNPVSDNRYTKKQINRWINIFSTPVLREVYVTASFIKPKIIKRKKDNSSRYVYEVHGCYFILSSMFAEYIKNKEFGVLLYSEETFISENIYLNNWKSYYDSELEVIHMEHATTSKLKPTRRALLSAESMIWIRDTFFCN